MQMPGRIFFVGLILFLTGTLLLVGSLSKKSGSEKPDGPPSVSTSTITFTTNGFSPLKIQINKGDIVTFYNETENAFWPASNFHPSHSLYSDFDPKKPIGVGASWSFTFTEPGEWKFHDHLSPYFEGEIIVGKNEESKITGPCGEIKNQQKQLLCWYAKVEKPLSEGRLNEAFKIIEDLYKNNEGGQFRSQCHDLVHNIGEATYIQFSKNKEWNIPPEVSLCNYGFYHGFMESLLQKKKDPIEARNFCLAMKEKLSQTTPDVFLQCFHGIGHGAVGIYPPDDWGNERVMVKKAQVLCESIVKTEEEKYRCMSGIYNGIGMAYQDNTDGLRVKKEDPFWICREQPEKYQAACYGNIIQPIFKIIAEENFLKGTVFIEKISNDTTAGEAMLYLAIISAKKIAVTGSLPEREVAIKNCRGTQKRLQEMCLKGMAAGFIEALPLPERYIKTFELCRHQKLSISEKKSCFQQAISHLKGIYSKENVEKFCVNLEELYRGYCQK